MTLSRAEVFHSMASPVIRSSSLGSRSFGQAVLLSEPLCRVFALYRVEKMNCLNELPSNSSVAPLSLPNARRDALCDL